jgi:hypothetical protein
MSFERQTAVDFQQLKSQPDLNGELLDANERLKASAAKAI